MCATALCGTCGSCVPARQGMASGDARSTRGPPSSEAWRWLGRGEAILALLFTPARQGGTPSPRRKPSPRPRYVFGPEASRDGWRGQTRLPVGLRMVRSTPTNIDKRVCRCHPAVRIAMSEAHYRKRTLQTAAVWSDATSVPVGILLAGLRGPGVMSGLTGRISVEPFDVMHELDVCIDELPPRRSPRRASSCPRLP